MAPLLFSVCGLFYTWGLFRFELFDRLPAARSMVIESMGDAMLVLDRTGRVAEFNPAAVALFGDAAALSGRTAADLFGPQFAAAFDALPQGGQRDLELPVQETVGSFEARF